MKSSSIKAILLVSGLLSCLAIQAADQRQIGKEPIQASAVGQRCKFVSDSKVFLRGEPDFLRVRAQINAQLENADALGVSRAIPQGAAYRISGGSNWYYISIDSLVCGNSINAQAEAKARSATTRSQILNCDEPYCGEPFPGDNLPNGSLMKIVSCDGSTKRTVEYKKIDGIWVVTKISQEAVTSCDLQPGDL